MANINGFSEQDKVNVTTALQSEINLSTREAVNQAGLEPNIAEFYARRSAQFLLTLGKVDAHAAIEGVELIIDMPGANFALRREMANVLDTWQADPEFGFKLSLSKLKAGSASQAGKYSEEALSARIKKGKEELGKLPYGSAFNTAGDPSIFIG